MTGVVERTRSLAYSIDLLAEGFRARIVHIETGIDLSYLRRMAKELSGGARSPSGSLPRSSTVLATRAALMEGALWAALYRSIGGNQIYRQLMLEEVRRSYRLYLELREELPLQMETPIDINRAWVLARDIRSDTAWIERCGVCGTIYIHALDQRFAPSCPSCDYFRDL